MRHLTAHHPIAQRRPPHPENTEGEYYGVRKFRMSRPLVTICSARRRLRRVPAALPLLAAALLAAATAGAQSIAEPVNRELPPWLRVGGEYRARLEATEDRGFAPGLDDTYLLNRIRANLKVQPSPWMKFVFQGQDDCVFFNDVVPNAPPYENHLDLRMGYLELGDPDSRTISLRAGRQEINFGDQRLVGSSNWSNNARTFDAVRATFRYHGYRLDAFASSVVVANADGLDRPNPGDNLHGLYGGIEKLVPQAVIEPYLFWRLSPRQATETGGHGNLDSKTVGVRWVGKVPRHLDYATEMALQRGSLGTDRVRAWAGHWVAGYTLDAAWKPRLVAEYNFASGDHDAKDGTRGTFDHLYPTPHDKYGLCDQVGWRNIHDMKYGVESKPHRRLGVAASYHNWWLADPHDALYSASGSVIARRADGTAGRHVGQEADLQAAFSVSKQTTVSAGLGHIFPGEFLRKATPGHPYTFSFLMLAYTF